MTQYTVLWDSELEQHFIDAWVKSDSQTRRILTEIANWIDAQLSVNPELKGRADAHGNDLRVLAVPLPDAQVSVVYQCFPKDREVLVVRLLFQRSRR